MATLGKIRSLRKHGYDALVFNTVQFGKGDYGVRLGWDAFIGDFTLSQAINNVFNSGCDYIQFSSKF